MTKCDNDDDDVTIFMDDTTVSEVIDIKNHIADEAIGNAEKNIREVMKFLNNQKMELNLKKCKEMLIDLRKKNQLFHLRTLRTIQLKGLLRISYWVCGLTIIYGEDSKESCETSFPP